MNTPTIVPAMTSFITVMNGCFCWGWRKSILRRMISAGLDDGVVLTSAGPSAFVIVSDWR